MSEDQEHVDVVLEEPKTAKKDEPEIEIVEEKPEKAASSDKGPVVEPQEGIQELKRRLEAEQRARYEAEKRAREAASYAQKANADVHDANYQLVKNAIETLKGRSDALKSAHKEAMSVGDYDKLADIQEAISVNAAQLADLERGKKAMKEARKQAEEEAQRQPQRMEPPADPIEDMASRVTEKSASWLRANKSNLQNEQKIGRMFRAHQDAIEDGIAADSDEYFAYIENRLGIRKQETVEDNAMSAAAAPAPKRAPQPPPAPVSRGNGRPNVVRLTREQAEMAQMLGMTGEEYAKHMVALQKEGKIGN